MGFLQQIMDPTPTKFSRAMTEMSPLLLGMAAGIRQGVPFQGVQSGLAQMMEQQRAKSEALEKRQADQMLAGLFSPAIEGSGFEQFATPVATPDTTGLGLGAAIDNADPMFRATPEFQHAVMMAESAGDPYAVSSKGALGLMQTMPGTLTDPGYGVRPASDPTNPAEQARVGRDYLDAMLQRYSGDRVRALVAYNWGPGNADKWNGRMESLPAETRNYVQRIMGSGAATSEQSSDGISREKVVQILRHPQIDAATKQFVLNEFRGQQVKPTDDMREYNLAQSQGYTGSFVDYMTDMRRAGATNITNTVGGTPEVGTIPQGYQLSQTEDGAWVMAPIPGGPADTSEKEANKDRQAKLKLGTSLESLQLNIAEIEDGGLPVTGAVGDLRRTGVGRFLTGNSAMDFGNRTNQITDAAAFAEIQNMRDNSPTGGAVGQLTDKERAAIGNAVTALNNSTSAEEYLRAAKAYRELALNLAFGEDMWTLDGEGGVVMGGAAKSAEIPDFTSMSEDEIVGFDLSSLDPAALKAWNEAMDRIGK